jgi:putative colanic acid biosynthesis UDP-glucose lipid carrier transferase
MVLMPKNNWGSLLWGVRPIVPLVVVVGTLFLSTWATGSDFKEPYVLLAFIAAILTYVLLGTVFSSDELESRLHASAAGRIVVGWAVVVGLLLLLGYAAKASAYFSRRALFVWFLMAPVLLLWTHTAIRYLARRIMAMPEMARSVVFAGVNEGSIRLARALRDHPELGMRVQGFFEDRGPERFGSLMDSEVAGKLADLPAYVKEHKVDVIFLSLPIRHVKRVLDLLDELHDTTASIYFLPDVFVFDLIQSRAQSICGLPAIALCETPFHGYRALAKRAMDIVVAAAALLVLLPVLGLIALLIRLGSPGSVIFRQRRYGLDGREITVYKFRTMYVSEDGEEIVQARQHDARVTPIGAFLRKYSLDELPQLINVLQGRMSLVGPRPHAVAHNEEYRKLIKGYMIRHKVLPGITGWAQVNGLRGETKHLKDMQARVEYDLDYLRNWSIGLDVKILFMTAWIVLKAEKAY